MRGSGGVSRSRRVMTRAEDDDEGGVRVGVQIGSPSRVHARASREHASNQSLSHLFLALHKIFTSDLALLSISSTELASEFSLTVTLSLLTNEP